MKKYSTKSKQVKKSSTDEDVDDNEEITPELATSTISESLHNHTENSDQITISKENESEGKTYEMELEVGNATVTGSKRKQPVADKDKKLSRTKKSPSKKIFRTGMLQSVLFLHSAKYYVHY